jgi:hypothetical protein
VVRFMRVTSAEALGRQLPFLKNTHVGTILALVLTLVPFLQIWVVFGAASELTARQTWLGMRATLSGATGPRLGSRLVGKQAPRRELSSLLREVRRALKEGTAPPTRGHCHGTYSG